MWRGVGESEANFLPNHEVDTINATILAQYRVSLMCPTSIPMASPLDRIWRSLLQIGHTISLPKTPLLRGGGPTPSRGAQPSWIPPFPPSRRMAIATTRTRDQRQAENRAGASCLLAGGEKRRIASTKRTAAFSSKCAFFFCSCVWRDAIVSGDSGYMAVLSQALDNPCKGHCKGHCKGQCICLLCCCLPSTLNSFMRWPFLTFLLLLAQYAHAATPRPWHSTLPSRGAGERTSRDPSLSHLPYSPPHKKRR